MMATVNNGRYREFSRSYDSGKYPSQRFGQAFCNTFGITDPDLFYAPSRKLAEEQIWRKYLGE